MAWIIDYEEDEEFFLELIKDGLAGDDIIGIIESKPALSVYESMYLRMFLALSSKRSYSMSGSPLPISFTEIKSFLDLDIYPIFDKEFFVDLIISLDSFFISKVTKQ